MLALKRRTPGARGRCALAALFLCLQWPAHAQSTATGTLLWWRGGQPTIQAEALLAQLAAAGDYGLRADDYGADRLANQYRELRGAAAPAGDAMLRADAALSAAALQFAHDLHFGRVDPAKAGFAVRARRPVLDNQALLERLAGSRDVPTELDSLEPPFLHYRLLKAALHRYQALAAQSELTQLPPLRARAVHEGEHYEGAPALRRLLLALGDLPSSAASGDEGVGRESIDAALAAALRHFQTRHGLAADGVLARRTYDALTTPLARRVHQIALTLERWRWLPAFTAPPIIVNIPQFQLFAFRTTDDHAADIAQMPVIVGQAYRQKRTPVFVAEMRYVVFRPYWDVPVSILRNEMLAPMRADPGYLERHQLEIVRGGGDDATVVAATPANIEALAAGQLRLRQRPGDDNSLGLIKFVMPNDYGVYLHGTPARHLFERARRDFSHGCIRLSDPVALAVHVLRGNEGDWSAAAVEAAMHGAADSRRITLATPVPVMVLYGTSLATEAGPVLFFDDIYGHDRRLEALLQARRVPGRER